MPAANNDRWTMFCVQHVKHASAKHAATAQGAVDKVSGPKDLFQALYHHFLCLADTSLQVVPTSGGPPQGKKGLSGTPANLVEVKGDTEGERILCVRAMAAVYAKHAAAIGMQHKLMKTTLYHCMLLQSYDRSDSWAPRDTVCGHDLFIYKCILLGQDLARCNCIPEKENQHLLPTLLAGPFDGVGHITLLLDCSMSKPLRCCLLRLLEAVLAPRSMVDAPRVIATNGQALVKAGAVQLAVDLIAGTDTRLIRLLSCTPVLAF